MRRRGSPRVRPARPATTTIPATGASRAGRSPGGRPGDTRRLRAAGVTVALAVALVGLTVPSAQAATDVVAVDFGASTGAFAGNAAGALYGLSDAGVPTAAVVAGANPVSITTKPPSGQQHPGSDPLEVAAEFFATGGQAIYVNIQDSYPDWPYNGGARPTDFTGYLSKITAAVKAIKQKDAAHFSKYYFVPFNEPDGGNWYGDYATLRTQFLADWSACFTAIKAVDPTARIAGPGLLGYNRQRLSDLLQYARARNQLPDVLTWHELSRSSLASYRSHFSDYRSLETSLGVAPRPINITEWGDRSDMSVPGQLVQWLAMFEDTKVAGNTAYWTFAGNLNDNAAGTQQANGGWWLLKWYADLSGNTVAVTDPRPNVPQTVQALATFDATREQGTVLLGGGGNDVTVNLNGLAQAGLGQAVDIRVYRDRWSGYDGTQTQPPLVLAKRVSLSGGATSVTIANTDRMSAYRVVVTSASGTVPQVEQAWSSTVEAENTTLANVSAFSQDTDAHPMLYATSGKADVGGTNKVNSSLTWSVTVPRGGSYRLDVLAGANKAPGDHALFVDGSFNQLIHYTADLGWTYRGRSEAIVSLTAGSHLLSIRTSKDGSTLLPGSDIALDRFDLTEINGPETSRYPARFARVIGTTTLVAGQGSAGALLQVDPTATGQFFLSTATNGYYDLAIGYRSPNGAAGLSVALNGRPITGLGSTTAGKWTATARVHLGQGTSELRITSPATVQLDTVDLTRATAGDGSTRLIEAESGTVAGTARVISIPGSTGSNVSGGADVGHLGNGTGNTLTLGRPAGTGAGQYDIGVHYANADQNTASHYNTDVISRSLTVTETGGRSVTAALRHNYSWVSFWWQTLPLNLITSGGDLVLGNGSGFAPDIDAITVSPLVLSTGVAATK